VNPQFSVYLDLVRLLASFTVFFSHLIIVGNPLLWRFKVFPGHLGVIVFFVLSGYVIAYVVFERKEHCSKFIVSRFTRIYSVVIPAMVITYLSFWFVQQNNPILLEVINDNQEVTLTQFFSVLFMLHQSWQQVHFLTNNPIWSIAFEMFYYIAFAVLIYTKGIKRITLFCCVVLVMGPNIFLYFPLWLLGVCSFCLATRCKTSLYLSLLLSFLPIFGIVYLFSSGVELWFHEISNAFVNNRLDELLNAQSQNLLHDYACAFLLSVHFVGMFNLLKYKSVFSKWLGKKIKVGAEMTFALYLLHLPLLYVTSAIFRPSSSSVVHALISLLLLPIVIFFLSKFIEARKAHYYSFFSSVIVKLTHFSNKIWASR